MKIISKLLVALRLKKAEPVKEPSKYDGIVVEHYPISGRYLVRYNGFPLHTHWPSGMVQQLPYTSFEHHAKKFNSEEDAWAYADLFLEHRCKVGVEYLTR